MKKIILFYRENTRWFICSVQHLKRVFVDWSLTSFFQEANFNKETEFNKNWFYRSAFLLLVLTQISSYGQSNTNNSQWGKNGPASAPASPVIWANGNAQATNSHFTEGQSIPTRIELAGLTAGQPASVTFNINITQGNAGQHAFDFFTGPNRIEEIVNPLDGLTGYNPAKSTYVFPIPNAGNTGGVPASYYNETALKMACQQNADAAYPDKNSIWIYNGVVSNITYLWGNENGASTQQTYCTVTFTPTQSKALLVLGCHIAAELTVSCEGWGVGNGASTISGSPYHFHIDSICSPLSNCVTLGSQDQQMASSSVIVPPTCSIAPSSAQICAGTTATFTASGNGGSGGAPYTFAWSGPNGYTATTAAITVSVAGTYSVIVSDKNGVPTDDPCMVSLVVNNSPTPSVDDEEACVGATATFTTALVPGYSYQWYLNNVLISDATSNSYTTPVLTLGDNGGVYKVIAIDGNHDTDCDGVDSGILTVIAIPVVDCPDDSMDNLVQCGVSATVAQSATNSSFNTWFGSFAGLNPGLEVVNVSYDYEPNNAQPFSGNAPLNPTLGVAGVVETSVLVTWTVRNASGCVSSCSATFALSYNCTIGCENTMTPVLCYGASTGSITVAAQGGTPPYTVNLYRAPDAAPYRTEGPLNTGAINVLFDNLPAGTYSYSVTDASNGDSCNNNESIIITQPEAALSSIISDVDILCNGNSTGSINLTPSGGTPPYTYAWTATNGGEVPAGQEGNQDLTGLIAGTYSVVITDFNGSTGGCRNENSTIISQPDVLSCSIVKNSDEQCAGGLNGSATVNVVGGIGEYSYLWDNNETTATASGLSGGLHSVTVTDSNGCSTSCEITIQTVPCDDDGYCTYTQGFYGNYNGLGCTPDYGVVNSHVMMTNALNQVGGSYNFGSTSTGNYFQLKLSDVTGAIKARDNNIYKMLPGGGTPRGLVGFATYDVFSTWSDNDPLTASGSKKGAINNNLLSQTMTLFFNLQIDSSLSSFGLESSFATAASVECGSNIPNMETVQVFTIPQGVIDYLSSNGGANVGNLFALANKALGGENIGGISHSNVNAAVDAINRGFDKCRIQVGIPVDVVGKAIDSKEIKVNTISTYPNPFKDYIGLNYMFDYDSNVDIQIFDVKGSLLYEFKDTNAYYGKEIRIDITFNHGKGELFILKLVTNKETIIKKVISSNY